MGGAGSRSTGSRLPPVRSRARVPSPERVGQRYSREEEPPRSTRTVETGNPRGAQRLAADIRS